MKNSELISDSVFIVELFEDMFGYELLTYSIGMSLGNSRSVEIHFSKKFNDVIKHNIDIEYKEDSTKIKSEMIGYDSNGRNAFRLTRNKIFKDFWFLSGDIKEYINIDYKKCKEKEIKNIQNEIEKLKHNYIISKSVYEEHTKYLTNLKETLESIQPI